VPFSPLGSGHWTPVLFVGGNWHISWDIHGVPNPAPADRLSCTVHLQPKSITPAFNFQVILKTLIGCFRCVWLELEINCAGQSIWK